MNYESLHSLFDILLDEGLNVQIISSRRMESNITFYYLKVFRIVHFCHLCREKGKGHESPCVGDVEQKSIHMDVYYDLNVMFDELLYIYGREKESNTVP